MYIFIDESGLFKPTGELNQWSSVGALVVPDESIDSVKDALLVLKAAHGIDADKEFKKRPDCSSEYYFGFLKTLKTNKCTLHVASVVCSENEEIALLEHRKSVKNGILNYFKKAEEKAPFADEAIKLLMNLSPQQYAQCMFQICMIDDLLGKIITFYAAFEPASLGTFKWELDAKDLSETKYERVFKMLYQGLLALFTESRPKPIIWTKDYDYSYFIKTFFVDMTEDSVRNAASLYGKDMLKAIRTIDYSGVLAENFCLLKSERSFGLQAVDLLVSGVNRCLKMNFSNNEKIAEALGALMINSAYIDEKAISLKNFSGDDFLNEPVKLLIDIMEENSFKLFSDGFKLNFSTTCYF